MGSEKETRFLGVAVGAKKPGFCCGYQELFVGCEKETRFLGFWGFLGVAVGRKKPGFCCGYQELFVGCEKETRFLGLYGVDITSYLWSAKKKPGFWGDRFADTVFY